MTAQTVGELRAAIAEFPDDMPIGGYNGHDGYRPVEVYVADRTKDEPPECKILVLDVD